MSTSKVKTIKFLF